jgi:ABC-type multidrug transport system fused ATPase/permease subunit
MKIISWIIFIGLCIKAGALIISSSVSLFVNQEAAKNLYSGLDLFNLYQFDKGYYIGVISLIITIAVLKAYMFYLVIKIFLKFDLKNPFTSNTAHLISKISYVALGIGVISKISNNYNKWLTTHRVEAYISLDFGSEDLLFMAGILFIVAYIFKHGVKIQSENELTI